MKARRAAPSQQRRLGDRELTIAIAAAPVVASILGWINAVQFYAPFGVSPGDLGLAVSDLIVPVAFSATVVLVAAIIAASFAADFGPRAKKFAPGVAFLAFLASWAIPLRGTTLRPSLAATAIGVLIGFELQHKRAKGKRVQGTDVFTFGGLLAAVAAGLLLDSTAMAHGVHSATPFPLRLGPVARFVRVVPAAGSTELAWLAGVACAIHLGDGPAGRVLVVAEHSGARTRVVFVNSQLASVEASDRCAIELPDGQKLAP